MNCPVCNVALTMTDRHDVEIDYCPKCRGVWLDRGELDKIIDRAAETAAATNPPQRSTGARYETRERYSERHDEYSPHHKKKKRESFLGELFDFD